MPANGKHRAQARGSESHTQPDPGMWGQSLAFGPALCHSSAHRAKRMSTTGLEDSDMNGWQHYNWFILQLESCQQPSLGFLLSLLPTEQAQIKTSQLEVGVETMAALSHWFLLIKSVVHPLMHWGLTGCYTKLHVNNYTSIEQSSSNFFMGSPLPSKNVETVVPPLYTQLPYVVKDLGIFSGCHPHSWLILCISTYLWEQLKYSCIVWSFLSLIKCSASVSSIPVTSPWNKWGSSHLRAIVPGSLQPLTSGSAPVTPGSSWPEDSHIHMNLFPQNQPHPQIRVFVY